MAKEGVIATVQILIKPSVVNEFRSGSAEDWFSGLLSNHPDILDWSYLKMGGQYLYPMRVTISNDYTEGEIFP